MQKQRPKCKGTAASSLTDNLAIAVAHVSRGLGLNPAKTVRARNHAKGAVVKGARIDVHAHRNQRFKHGKRGLHIERALFVGPASQARVLDPRCDRNAKVLMNWNEPVLRSGLLEIRALNSDEVLRYQGHSAPQEGCQLLAPRFAKKRAGSSRYGAGRFEFLRNGCAFVLREQVRHENKAVLCEGSSVHALRSNVK